MTGCVETVIKNTAQLGEGPFWDAKSQALYYVDLFKGDVCKYDSLTGEVSRLNLGGGTTSIVIPREKGGYVVTRQTDVAILNSWKSSELKAITRVYDDSEMMLNDGKVDARGRLWIGSCYCDKTNTDPSTWPEGRGSLYSVDVTGDVRKHVSGITISNGLDWSIDNSVMYFIDSVPRKVYAFDFNLEEGSISNQKTLADFSGSDVPDLGYPDGMTVDEEGKLWVTCSRGSKVVRLDGETGQVIRAVQLPVAFLTSCCFGGNDYSELYVTSAITSNPEPLAGSIFKVTHLGVKGRQQHFYKG